MLGDFTISLFLMLCLSSIVFGSENDARQSTGVASATALVIEPDAQVQDSLAAIEACMDRDPVEFFRQILALKRKIISGSRNAEFVRRSNVLVRQLAMYVAENRRVSPPPAFFTKFIYAASINKTSLVDALAAFVDSPDLILKSWVTDEVLGGVDLEGCGPLQFVPIDSYGFSHKHDFSPTLVDIMYRQNEKCAIGALQGFFETTAEEGKNISFAIHAVDEVGFYKSWNELRQPLVDEAVARLKVLLASPNWWVRRYVAEVVWRYETFRNSELYKEVQHDPDTRVSNAATRPDADWMVSERNMAGLLRSLKQVSQ